MTTKMHTFDFPQKIKINGKNIVESFLRVKNTFINIRCLKQRTFFYLTAEIDFQSNAHFCHEYFFYIYVCHIRRINKLEGR